MSFCTVIPLSDVWGREKYPLKTTLPPLKIGIPVIARCISFKITMIEKYSFSDIEISPEICESVYFLELCKINRSGILKSK